MKSEAYYQHQNPKENRKEKQLEITEPMEIETEPQSVEEKYQCRIPESFQLQMGFSFPFLRANYLRPYLLNIRARSFLLSCT